MQRKRTSIAHLIRLPYRSSLDSPLEGALRENGFLHEIGESCTRRHDAGNRFLTDNRIILTWKSEPKSRLLDHVISHPRGRIDRGEHGDG